MGKESDNTADLTILKENNALSHIIDLQSL